MTRAELLQHKAQLLLKCAEEPGVRNAELVDVANSYLQRAAELINLPGPSENHEAISERVKKQLRDRHGRWIKMHSEVTVHSPFSGETFTGKVTSIDPNNNEVHVKLDDVTASVPVDPKNIEAVEAVLHHPDGTTQTLAEHVAAGTPEAKPYTFIQHSIHSHPDGSKIHRISAKDAAGQTYAQMEFDNTGKAVHAAGAHGPQGQEAFKDIRAHADDHIFTSSVSGEPYTSDELKAIKDYTYDSNSGINEYLRGFTESISEENRQTLNQLNNAIQKDKLDGGTTLWRAAGAGAVPDTTLEPGTEITDKAFISTTSDKVIAAGPHSEFDNSIVFEIHAAAGTPVIDVEKTFNQHPDDTEGEFILNRGTTFRVISDSGLPEDEINGQRYIKVEVVNHGDTSQWKHQSKVQLEEGGHSDNATAAGEEHSAEIDKSEFDVSGWQKVGGQGGSNPGGTYQAPNGEQWYVKDAPTAAHVQNEALASAFYRDLGVDVPEVRVATQDGKTVIASKIVPGAKSDLESKLSDPAYKQKLQNGFVADSWLANWDVAGLVYDNVVTGSDGNPWRIDTGGSLLYRAMGTPKNSLFGDTVGEIETLRDPSMNPTSANVFSGMTDAQIKDQVQHLVDTMSDDKIKELVHAEKFEPNAEKKLISTLINRRDYLANKYGVKPGDPQNSVEEHPLPGAGMPISDAVTAGDLKTGDKFYGVQNVVGAQGEPNGLIYSVEKIENWPDGSVVLHVDDGHGNKSVSEYDGQDLIWKAPAAAQPYNAAVVSGNDAAPGNSEDTSNEPYQLGWSNEKIEVGHQVKSMTDGKTGTVVKLEDNGLYVKVKMDHDGKIKGRKASTLVLAKQPKPAALTPPSPGSPAVVPSNPASLKPMDIASVRQRVDAALHDGENHGVTSFDLDPVELQKSLDTQSSKSILVKPPGGYEVYLDREDVEALVKSAGLHVSTPPQVQPLTGFDGKPVAIGDTVVFNGPNDTEMIGIVDATHPDEEIAEISAEDGETYHVHQSNLKKKLVTSEHPVAAGDKATVGNAHGTVQSVAEDGIYFKADKTGSVIFAPHGLYTVYGKTAPSAVSVPAQSTPQEPQVSGPSVTTKKGDKVYKGSSIEYWSAKKQKYVSAVVTHVTGGSSPWTKVINSDDHQTQNVHKDNISTVKSTLPPVASSPSEATSMKDVYGKDVKVGDYVEVEQYDSDDGAPSWEHGHLIDITNGKATVETGDDTIFDLPSDQVKLINSSVADHPNEPPQLEEPPNVETYTPKQGEKSVFGNGNVPIYKGSKVKSLNDGLEGTVVAIEANGEYVKVKGVDGKIRGRKRTTLEVTAHPNGATPNHANALNGISITDTSPKVDAVPAELQKYVGQPAPKQPSAPQITKGQFVTSIWIQAVKDRYASFSPGKSIENSKNWSRVQSVINNGSLEDLQHLLTRSYIDQAMFDEAKATIETKKQHDANLLAQHDADLKAWQHELMLWNKANGVKGGIFDPENFVPQGIDGARDWSTAAAGTQWAKKTWPGSSFYNSSQLSALQSYAGTSTGFNQPLWSLKESSLDSGNVPPKVKNLDSAMEAAPRVPEDIIVRRGTETGQFVGKNGIRLSDYGADLSTIQGTIQVHWGFTSTSVAPNSAFSSRDVQMTIRVPKGFKAVYMHGNGISGHSEYELLLDRGAHLYIHSVKQTSGKYGDVKWIVDAEIVPPGWPEDKSIPVLSGARFS